MKQTDGVVNYRDSKLYQQFNETRNSILEPFWVAFASIVPEMAIEELVITVAAKTGFFAIMVNSVKGVFKSDSKAVAVADDVVKTTDVMKNRVKLRKETKEAIRDAAPKTKDGKFIDPNTGKPTEKG
ncbi:hypothetical protein ASG21_17750 [Chryseobacterium sp. Leaf394]|nr:hypothetical protein ASG21_17750 [Chryseobacterium sp. Leaf394]